MPHVPRYGLWMYQHDGVKGSLFNMPGGRSHSSLFWSSRAISCERTKLAARELCWTQNPVLQLAFKVFNESKEAMTVAIYQNHPMKVCACHNVFEGLFLTLMHWYICFFLLYTAFPFPCPRSDGHKWPSSHDLCSPSTSALPVVRFPTQTPWKYSHCSLEC